MELISFIKEYFWHAAPILIVGAAGLTIILERFYCLFFRYPMYEAEIFFKRISASVMKADLAEASKLCERYRHKPLARVVQAGMARAHLPEGLIHDGIQLNLQRGSRLILKRTSFLATIANVSTLLGLLGTIAGLIQSFQAVAHADAQQKAALLSQGISTAMNATMLGLGVAIPCMIAYSILINRSNGLLADLEQAAVRSMDILKQRYYASEMVSPPAKPSDEENVSMRRAS